jgi:peptidoglycan DL-endopeptidase LytE
MKYFKIVILLLLYTNTTFSQERFINHKITKGETLSSISDKFNVKLKEIYDLNPKAKGILKLNSILKIPNHNFSPNKKDSPQFIAKTNITHEVLAKETIYGISKQYGVTVEAINEANPALVTDGLAIGSKITIPQVNQQKIKPQVAILSQPKSEKITSKPIATKTIEILNENNLEHEVLPKQTKYGIAKQYGMTIQELETQNPEIINGLPIGYKLNIRNSRQTIIVAANEKPIVASTTEVKEEITASASTTNALGETQSEFLTVTDAVTFAENMPVEYANKLDFLVANASENIGVRYRSGGTSKAGFDCSGLMITAFNTIDVKLPRTSREQSNYGSKVAPQEAQKGDLIFFSTNGSGRVNHVGMVVEVIDDEIKFIHSSVHGGVIISSNKEAYYARTFIKVNRVMSNTAID